ncbi:MAG: DUF1992 domain-containing protein [Aureispira sp.]|nr:DUF1992 domain-containing protein [Aureispira sp.]
MSLFDKLVEQKIQAAIKQGDFDSFEGFGKPMDNTDYFNAPKEERMLFHILKNAGIVPEEIQLRKDMLKLQDQINSSDNLNTKKSLHQKFLTLQSKYNILIEKRKLNR